MDQPFQTSFSVQEKKGTVAARIPREPHSPAPPKSKGVITGWGESPPAKHPDNTTQNPRHFAGATPPRMLGAPDGRGARR